MCRSSGNRNIFYSEQTRLWISLASFKCADKSTRFFVLVDSVPAGVLKRLNQVPVVTCALLLCGKGYMEYIFGIRHNDKK